MFTGEVAQKLNNLFVRANAIFANLKENDRMKRLQKYAKSSYWKKAGWSFTRAILLLGLLFVLIYPLLFIIVTSIKSLEDMYNSTVVWIPRQPTLENYKLVWQYMNYPQSITNTVFLSLITTLLQIASCGIIGYGFARFKFKERNFIFGLVVFTMILAPQVLIVPNFMLFKNFDLFGLISIFKPGGINLLDSFWPFILPSMFGMGLKGGLFIYIFRQFFRGMPKELEDAAYIDGCGPLQTFIRIMLPNAIPAIVTVFLFSFVWHWNDVFEPKVYLTSPNLYTLAMKLTEIDLHAMGSRDSLLKDPIKVLPPRYAGVMYVISPMLLLYAIGQKYFVSSVERTGIVG